MLLLGSALLTLESSSVSKQEDFTEGHGMGAKMQDGGKIRTLFAVGQTQGFSSVSATSVSCAVILTDK